MAIVAGATLVSACRGGAGPLPSVPLPQALRDARAELPAPPTPRTTTPIDTAPVPGFGFALDPTRPFVSVTFDDLGPREPVYETERPFGVWLALHNNCPYTISLSSYRTGPDQPGYEASRLGVLLSYEVVKRPPLADAPMTARLPKRKLPYVGSWYGYVHLPQCVDVLPRQDVMFSVPIDVLVPDVYLRIRVEPRMPPAAGEQPHIYLEFGRENIPDDVRGEIDRLVSVGARR